MSTTSFLFESICNVHSHLREGKEVMRHLIALSIQGGADIVLPMPNTTAGLTTCEQVLQYTSQAKSLVPADHSLEFIPTLLVTETTPEDEIRRCVDAGIKDCKIYPRDRTTKSHNGVRDYGRLLSKIRVCGEIGMKVHLHPEHPWMTIGNRDAEFCFLSIADMFLRETDAIIVWEHGTDARCIRSWKELAESQRFYLTLTAHHLTTNEDMAFGDIRLVCKPPIKTESDRSSLVQLVCENHDWVMAGGDDAAHDVNAKHVYSGQCACGAYTAPFLLPLYAHTLDNLIMSGDSGRQTFARFTSRNARTLHQLPNANASRTLVRQEFTIPDFYQVGPWKVEPPFAGKTLLYSF